MKIRCLYGLAPLVKFKSYAVAHPETNTIVLYEHLRGLPKPIKKVIVAHEEIHIRFPWIKHEEFGDLDHMLIETIASLDSTNPIDYVHMSKVLNEELLEWCYKKYQQDFKFNKSPQK